MVSKQELRFSSAKEYKNTWSSAFGIFAAVAAVAGAGEAPKIINIFGPVTSNSVFTYVSESRAAKTV